MPTVNDLPPQDELTTWLKDVLTPAEALRRYDEACHWDTGKTDPATMMAARAAGVLMTREEFINRFNIDMESCDQAFREIAPAWYAVMPYETVEVLMHGILDAALKEDTE